mgnify:CR=1 FL=1
MTDTTFLTTPTGAIFSPCQRYRYALWRRWEAEPSYVLFVGLNPSTADAERDDPTIRRCIGFARAWGYGGVLVGNLFAYRATLPRDLKAAGDPVGAENEVWLRGLAERANLVVAAWGNHGSFRQQAGAVLPLLPEPHALHVTQQGQPGHPLYLPRTCQPFPFP